jgi:hypothetical protein
MARDVVRQGGRLFNFRRQSGGLLQKEGVEKGDVV